MMGVLISSNGDIRTTDKDATLGTQGSRKMFKMKPLRGYLSILNEYGISLLRHMHILFIVTKYKVKSRKFERRFFEILAYSK